MIVDCAHYLDGARQAEGTLAPLDAARLCTGDGFVWLGLFEPTPDEMESVREAFDLHELAVEDAQDYHLRPKVEDFEASVKLVILRTARYDDAREEVDFGEISVFVAKNFVITVRQGVASELHEARARLEQKPELLALGTDAVLWAILDQVVDGYEPVVAGLEHDIEQIEATVFSGAVAPTERIYLLRREVTNFYRAAHPLLAVVTAVGKGLGEERLAPYLRDVYDRLQLVNEEVSAQRDLLGTILQANIAVVSVQQAHSAARQSSTIERLTILSTIFLPLTFVTGFFGQNFGWLVDHIGGEWQFFILGIGGLLIPLVALALWLRRNKDPEIDPFASAHHGGHSTSGGAASAIGGQPPADRADGQR
ncbi:magnesium and cobalt transport protein CorA [Tsukamurella sputi]|uniref:Magnesium and cobalt transport protein CorA n=1 Tax=Tsukamurella sputi TaxID=2591848 RepID=A0A5C5RRT6_9ACTN|nr:magnesium and cobalt transport protein CorA [Tsukamurella sputi]TWS25302.1 magnesium and cobalt transport protein CorA [Tsukamurella sputi]